MTTKLELVREAKLYRLIPGKKASDALEASGVALVDDHTALVIFDSLNEVARIDLSLRPNERNQLFGAPSIGEGFEDIAIDREKNRIFCVIETMEDTDGKYRSFVSEYDDAGRLQRVERLGTTFQSPNKGFEGIAFLREDGRDYLYAMCEGNLCTDATSGGGRIQAFTREGDGYWTWSHELALPMTAEFEDYAGIAYDEGRLAVVSQASARVWTARIGVHARTIVHGSERTFRFPKKSYGNVEGIAWLADDMLVAVSDRMKGHQPAKCAKRDQSIHVFRMPPTVT